MADSKTPYGPKSQVNYADPGYQKDGKARYPLDTEAHCRAAWSYISMPKNAAQYTAEQLSAIKGRIRSALKKFGVETESKAAGPLAVDVARAVDMPQEFRDAVSEADGLGLMTGHFSVFDTWYRVESKWEGTFLERVDPGAFTQTIAKDRSRMKVLFDHGFDPTIGNKVLGPIRDLRPDQRGAYYEVPLFDTSYNRDLLPGLKAGVYGASMRMRVLDDTWDDKPARSEHNPDGIKERTITRAGVPEFGAVTFPASPGASAGVRSTTDQFYDQLRQRDSSSYEAAVRAVEQVLPDFTGVSDARSSDRGEPGTQVPTSLTTRQRLDEGALRLRGILR
jgi:HK97 family phage prohead protease